MLFLPAKKQKHSDEGGNSGDFQEWWTEVYGYD
jgi:hypothetical protein